MNEQWQTEHQGNQISDIHAAATRRNTANAIYAATRRNTDSAIYAATSFAHKPLHGGDYATKSATQLLLMHPLQRRHFPNSEYCSRLLMLITNI